MDGVPGPELQGHRAGRGVCLPVHASSSTAPTGITAIPGFRNSRASYGPLVIDAREPEPFQYDRDYVVMLTRIGPTKTRSALMKTLKKQSDYYNLPQAHRRRFLSDDVRAKAGRPRPPIARCGHEMKMNPTDLADVSGATYTYLINGQAPEPTGPGVFRGGRDGSPALYQRLGHELLRCAHSRAENDRCCSRWPDRSNPVRVDEFRIAVAETFDVMVEPIGTAYTVFAQSMDRTGYARGSAGPPGWRRRASADAGPAPVGHHGGHGHGWHGSRRHGWHATTAGMAMPGMQISPDSGTQ